MAMTWGWFNLITISTYFDIFRQHLSGLNVLQLFFSNARFFEATLVPLSIVHCPSLWVDTPTETYTSALCGHSAVDACVVWWNDCIPETCGAKIENLLRKEAMKTEQTFSAVFFPLLQKWASSHSSKNLQHTLHPWWPIIKVWSITKTMLHCSTI
jgi:hypothetical protein